MLHCDAIKIYMASLKDKRAGILMMIFKMDPQRKGLFELN
jgi:hypothetical protein